MLLFKIFFGFIAGLEIMRIVTHDVYGYVNIAKHILNSFLYKLVN